MVAAALRIWSWNEQIVAVAFVDSPEVLRMTVAPNFGVSRNWLTRSLRTCPNRSAASFPAASTETPDGTLVRDVLADAGWSAGEAWTPLRRDSRNRSRPRRCGSR